MKKTKRVIVFISVIPLALLYSFFIGLADALKSFVGTMEDFFNEFNDIV
jgi:hypothetical protein